MGVPKRKKSHARQGDRRAHHALTLPSMDRC
ncbi:MAG: 50S ribosomal protein L32, partial [Candidatus Limnocylindrus sp.]